MSKIEVLRANFLRDETLQFLKSNSKFQAEPFKSLFLSTCVTKIVGNGLKMTMTYMKNETRSKSSYIYYDLVYILRPF